MDNTVKYTEKIKKQIEASAKELEKLIKLFEDLEKTTEKPASKAPEILAKIEKKAALATMGINALASSFEELGKATGDAKFTRYAAEMKDAAQMLQSTIDGAKAGGGWGALAGLAIGILKSVASGIASQKKNEREWENQTLAFQHEYNKLLVERNYLEKEFSSMFGKQNIERARRAYASAQDAWNKYQDGLNKELTGDTSSSKTQKDFLNPLGVVTEVADDVLDSFGKGGKAIRQFGDKVAERLGESVPLLKWLGIGRTISNKNEVLSDAKERGMNSLQGQLIQTKERKWYKIGSSDRYTTLYDTAPDLWHGRIDGEFDVEAAEKFLATNKKISEEQRQQIQEVIDWKKEYDEALAVVDKQIEDTFGKLAGSITNGIFDSIRNGSDAWAIFEAAGLDVIDNLGKQMVQEMIISAFTDKYKERMREAYKLGSVEETQKELANIMTDMGKEMPGTIQMATDAAQQWDQMARDQGWDMDKLKTAKVEKKMELGLSLETLQSGLDSLVKQADLTFEDISKSFAGHMSNAILQMVKNKYLTEQLNEWYKHFEVAMNDGELTREESDSLREEYKATVEASNKMYKEAMAAAGLDIPDDREATAGGIASMSQESAEELNGNFYALIYLVDDIHKIMQKRYGISDTFNLAASGQNALLPTMEDMLEVSRSSNTYLLDIRNNTSHLIAIDSNLANMNYNILAIRNDGIKMRS